MKSDRTYILKSYTQKHRSFPIDLTETGKWELLSPSPRLIFYSMWNSTKTNTAGVFRGSNATLRYITGIKTNRLISNAVAELLEAGLVVSLPEGGFYLPDWFAHNCSSKEFAISAISDLQKKWPSLLERFVSDHNRKLLKHKDHLSPNQYLSPDTDIQFPVNRYAVTEVNTLRGNQRDDFQEVIQRLKHKIAPEMREEFDHVIARIVREDLSDDEALKILSPFGLAAVEHEEILCSRPDNYIWLGPEDK